jgi:hypothetical protein
VGPFSRPDRNRPATASTISALPSIPILIAATSKSNSTASICATTISGGARWVARTPRVFCAVRAVIAVAA